jgi:hypothetical protein
MSLSTEKEVKYIRNGILIHLLFPVVKWYEFEI